MTWLRYDLLTGREQRVSEKEAREAAERMGWVESDTEWQFLCMVRIFYTQSCMFNREVEICESSQ